MKLVANVLFAAALVAGTANVAQAAGDAEAGKNKSAVCGACHGADGNSAIPNFPKLAGQVESYTIKQLKDMKSGDRQVPEMAGNTAMIVMPEHGRNEEANGIIDANAFLAYDHSDANARRIFGMMVGPNIDANLSIGSETNGMRGLHFTRLDPSIGPPESGFKDVVLINGSYGLGESVVQGLKLCLQLGRILSS